MKRLLIALFAVFPTIAFAGFSIQNSGNSQNVGNLQFVAGSTIITNGTISVATGTPGYVPIFISTWGSVGVGNVNPNASIPFHVSSPGETSRIARFSGNADGNGLEIRSAASNRIVIDATSGDTTRMTVGGVQVAEFLDYNNVSMFDLNREAGCGKTTTAWNTTGTLCATSNANDSIYVSTSVSGFAAVVTYLQPGVCESVTPTFIGQHCYEVNSSSPIWVATSTANGSMAPVKLAGVNDAP